MDKEMTVLEQIATDHPDDDIAIRGCDDVAMVGAVLKNSMSSPDGIVDEELDGTCACAIGQGWAIRDNPHSFVDLLASALRNARRYGMHLYVVSGTKVADGDDDNAREIIIDRCTVRAIL